MTVTVPFSTVNLYYEIQQQPLSASDSDRQAVIDGFLNAPSIAPEFLYVPVGGFQVITVAQFGNLVGDDNGNFVYTPEDTFAGDDFFTFQMCTDPSCAVSGIALVGIRVLILATDQYYETAQVRLLFFLLVFSFLVFFSLFCFFFFFFWLFLFIRISFSFKKPKLTLSPNNIALHGVHRSSECYDCLLDRPWLPGDQHYSIRPQRASSIGTGSLRAEQLHPQRAL